MCADVHDSVAKEKKIYEIDWLEIICRYGFSLIYFLVHLESFDDD